MTTHMGIERLREMSLSQYCLGLAAFCIIFWSVVLLRLLTGMSWVEISIIVSALIILALALIWSIREVKRLTD